MFDVFIITILRWISILALERKIQAKKWI
jgi:hypothetical protein